MTNGTESTLDGMSVAELEALSQRVAATLERAKERAYVTSGRYRWDGATLEYNGPLVGWRPSAHHDRFLGLAVYDGIGKDELRALAAILAHIADNR